MRVRLLNQQNSGVDDFRQIVRRDVRRHADRDAGRPVDQQVRNARRQYFRLNAPFIEIRPEIDRLFVQVFEQRRVDPREPRFGVPIGRRRIAVHRSKVPLPVDQRIAQRKILRHAHQRVVYRRVAMRMIIAQHFADDAGALPVRPVERQPHLGHGEENPPMHRLQTVPNIGQRAADDHAHRVIEIRPAHLVFDVDGD